MPSFVVVEKTGSLKSQKVGGVSDLYKKCGFKNSEGFSCVHTWTIDFNDIEYKLSIFGKTDGKANTENKFEFPPPIDNVLFWATYTSRRRRLLLLLRYLRTRCRSTRHTSCQ